MTKFLLPAFLLFALTACQNDGGGQGSAVPASPANSPANSPSNTSTEAYTPPSTQNNSGVAINPPHGEPGHVCEIPVGEPLDGSGGGNSNEMIINPSDAGGTSTTITPGLSPAGAGDAGTTAPGMNPPHGQPGHVCEIPVGEPLP